MTRLKPAAARLAAVLLLAAAVAPLGACATYPVGVKDAPAMAGGMMLSASDTGAVPVAAGAPGYQAVGQVKAKGGGKWNPLMTSTIGTEAFAEALTGSLKTLGYLAPSGGNYEVLAEIESIDRPIAGLNMSVTLKVRYTVRPLGGGAPVFTDLVAASGDGDVSSSLMAGDRLRIANEAAAKANIAEFSRRLKSDWK